jgi:hypothetical protein
MQAFNLKYQASPDRVASPSLPKAFAAKAFPGLQQHKQQQQVQLCFTVDGADSTPTTGMLVCC